MTPVEGEGCVYLKTVTWNVEGGQLFFSCQQSSPYFKASFYSPSFPPSIPSKQIKKEQSKWLHQTADMAMVDD